MPLNYEFLHRSLGNASSIILFLLMRGMNVAFGFENIFGKEINISGKKITFGSIV